MNKIKVQTHNLNGMDYGHDGLLPFLERVCSFEFVKSNPDLFIYSKWTPPALLRTINSTKLFLCGENIVPNFDECDFAISCRYVEDKYKHRHVYHPLVMNGITEDVNNRNTVIHNKRDRFCNFIYSNGSNYYEGVRLRNMLFKKLSQYKTVDAPGAVYHNLNADTLSKRYSENYAESKIQFIKNYKFTIAVENSYGLGYCTEKLSGPLIAGSMPIYWGYVPPFINKKTIIYVNDFKDLDELVAYIKYLDQDDAAYMRILQQKPLNDLYDFNWEASIKKFMGSIVDSISNNKQ